VGRAFLQKGPPHTPPQKLLNICDQSGRLRPHRVAFPSDVIVHFGRTQGFVSTDSSFSGSTGRDTGRYQSEHPSLSSFRKERGKEGDSPVAPTETQIKTGHQTCISRGGHAGPPLHQRWWFRQPFKSFRKGVPQRICVFPSTAGPSIAYIRDSGLDRGQIVSRLCGIPRFAGLDSCFRRNDGRERQPGDRRSPLHLRRCQHRLICLSLRGRTRRSAPTQGLCLPLAI
jgi:hypothetical protein